MVDYIRVSKLLFVSVMSCRKGCINWLSIHVYIRNGPTVFVHGSSCLVGCVILRQQPVKMLHLLSGDLHMSACAGGGGVLAS